MVAVVAEFPRTGDDIIAGAPTSHEPSDNAPRRVEMGMSCIYATAAPQERQNLTGPSIWTPHMLQKVVRPTNTV